MHGSGQSYAIVIQWGGKYNFISYSKQPLALTFSTNETHTDGTGLRRGQNAGLKCGHFTVHFSQGWIIWGILSQCSHFRLPTPFLSLTNLWFPNYPHLHHMCSKGSGNWVTRTTTAERTARERERIKRIMESVQMQAISNTTCACVCVM